MNKYRGFMGMSVLVLAFGLLVVGCSQQSGDKDKQSAEAKKDKGKGKDAKVKEGGDGHSLDGYWCVEHGLPEEECSLCSAEKAAEFKAKGDWCEVHDRAKSQCFKCDPSKYDRFAAMYRAKFGKEPPRPPQSEFQK